MNYTAQDVEEAKELKMEGYNWVARDREQDIFAYLEKPKKGISVWIAKSNSKQICGYRFPSILWEDTKPTNLDDIIMSERNEHENGTNYERLTMGFFECSLCKYGICEKPNSLCKDRLYCEIHNRLYEIENKIENGELVFKED